MPKPVLDSLHTVTFDNSEPADPKFEQLIEQVTAQIHDGQPIDLLQLAAEHPDYAEQIRELLPAMEMLVRLGEMPSERAATKGQQQASSSHQHQEHQLGDYRIIGELGRGGMGVVYEAEQISLGRRVALKVLPFAGMLDQQQLARFKNEARAAATLHHPNIVPIHAVGSDRGVHYYAMQLIEGQSLADLIAAMRPHESTSETPSEPADQNHTRATNDTVKAALPTLVTLRTSGSTSFFRAVAQLGIQAAEALDHAHQNGVLHRDIKPANLLVDGAEKLWITDFGLARMEADAGMTMSGDLLGTLRYMSPEQALAKRVVVDHRSDIYSLGATLYELLTLQPAFGETDRSELLKQIAFEDPLPPRQLIRNIPVEMETIVLKAMRKSPTERYATAQELADDLKRFLDNRPIKAKPPTLREKTTKWSRRHPAAIWAMAFTLLATTALSAISALLIANAYQREAAQRKIAEAERERSERNFELIRIPVRRLIDHAAMGGKDWSQLSPALRKTFSDLAIDFYEQLLQEKSDDPRAQYETAVAYRSLWQLHRTHGAPLVNGMRQPVAPLLDRSIAILDRLHSEYPESNVYTYQLALSTYLRATRYMEDRPRDAEAELEKAFALYKAAVLKTPEDEDTVNEFDACWLALERLRNARGESSKSLRDEVLETYRKLTIRVPNSARIHSALAHSISRISDIHEAIGHLREAVRLEPKNPNRLANLANPLMDVGMLDEAITRFREAVELDPKHPDRPTFLNGLGEALSRNGQLDEAILVCREALGPEAVSHHNLGVLLHKRGLVEEAIGEFREAIRVDPKQPLYYLRCGDALHDQGLEAEAHEAYAKTIDVGQNRLQSSPSDALALRALASLFINCREERLRDPEEGLRLAKKGFDLERNSAAYLRRGMAEYRARDFDAAVQTLEKTQQLQSDLPSTYFFLAMAEWNRGNRGKAREWYAKATDWMKQHPQVVGGDIRRFQSEAQQLLGIDTKTEPELVNQNVTEDSK